MTSVLLRMTTALGLCLMAAQPLAAQEAGAARGGGAEEAGLAVLDVDAGAYLAGRNAEASGDFRAAAAWFGQALLVDPGNAQVVDGAVFANLVLGRIDVAAELAAKRPAAQAQDGELQLAQYAFIAKAALDEDYPALVTAFGSENGIGPLVDVLGLAWAQLGQGDMSAALAQFDKAMKTRGLELYGMYHKALALALAGDFEGAEKILSGPIRLDPRGVIIRAQILSQLGRNEDALALLAEVWAPGSEPVADAMRASMQAGETLAFDALRSPRDGLAEVFYSLASLLTGEADPAYTLLNTRIAEMLNPEHDHAVLLGAAMLENLGEYDLAEEAYARFAPSHPAYYTAQLGRSEALYAAGRKEAAIEVLQKLTGSHSELLIVHAALGDALRRESRWSEAEIAYGHAIDLLRENDPAAWFLYFNRAISRERQQSYEGADADFRKAISFNPRQPEVLNYLGYSMIERGINLEEAMGMIRLAVEIQPEAGYIIDSLAWAHFTLGEYDKALAPMEKASVLEPVDPVVTDHLGDVYWMNGRIREAEFQWHRALSYGPEEKDAARIRRKLELGLDAVMAEEAEGRAPAGGQ